MIAALDRVVRALRVLPGVGVKTATRYAYTLLKADPSVAAEMAAAVAELHDRVTTCSACHNWTETDPCELCLSRAEIASICVVEQPWDVVAIERTGRFHGRYHVLGGVLDPAGGVTLADLYIDDLFGRLAGYDDAELLLALSPTREGEATCRLIAAMAADSGVRVTRLAYGLPLGSQLEYLDEGTLALALDHRRLYGD